MNNKASVAASSAAEIPSNNNVIEIFTEPEAAKLLKVARITLQRARLRGEIAFSRIGGCRVVYTRKHLFDYVESRERAAYARQN